MFGGKRKAALSAGAAQSSVEDRIVVGVGWWNCSQEKVWDVDDVCRSIGRIHIQR